MEQYLTALKFLLENLSDIDSTLAGKNYERN